MAVTIQVLWDTREAGHVAPLERATDALAGCGYELAPTRCEDFAHALRVIDRSADALLVHQTLVTDEVLAAGPPVVILERVDGAQLAASRQWLHRDEVRAVIKGYTFRDPEMNNASRGRYHTQLLAEWGVKPSGESKAVKGLPKPQLSATELDKIHLGYGFASHASMKLFHHPVAWNAPRGCPVMFAGWVEYSGSEIETHRRQAIKKVLALGGIACVGRPLTKPEYIHAMDKSAAVLSPWGWGEACYRDYEAILRGCVLIKPNSYHVKAWPDIFAGQAIAVCKPDLSDVKSAVECATIFRERHDIIADLDALRTSVVLAWQPKQIAKRLADIFRRVL